MIIVAGRLAARGSRVLFCVTLNDFSCVYKTE
jgi:hypothetical protein